MVIIDVIIDVIALVTPAQIVYVTCPVHLRYVVSLPMCPSCCWQLAFLWSGRAAHNHAVAASQEGSRWLQEATQRQAQSKNSARTSGTSTRTSSPTIVTSLEISDVNKRAMEKANAGASATPECSIDAKSQAHAIAGESKPSSTSPPAHTHTRIRSRSCGRSCANVSGNN